MPKWFSLILLATLLFVPFPAQAQEQITFEQVVVQLWPEYDTPDMLIILNLQLSADIPLPTQLKVRLPGSVEKPYVIAIGQTPQTVTDQGIEFTYEKNGDWLETTVTATGPAIRIEYYDPGLIQAGDQRSYDYVWAGDYAVDIFSLSILVPVDTTEIQTDPAMSEFTSADGMQTYLNWEANNLEAGEQVPIKVTYTKVSDRLSVSNQPLETGAIDESTQGRVSLSNYLPYILGGLGLLLIIGGGIYFWQTSQDKPAPRKRHRSRERDADGANIYCHQCGKRAQHGDRFCRTCGTRLRKET